MAAIDPKAEKRELEPSTHRSNHYLRKSSLDRDCVEGYMIMHVKKPRKKLFTKRARPSFYVVADAKKNVLEIYSNETKSELIYLLSLTNALLSFESDDANMVMEKCFCVEAKMWKKRNTVNFKHQGFVFFEDNQVRMLLWVKCIHIAIKKASTMATDRELFRSSAASNTSDYSPFSDEEHQYEQDHEMDRDRDSETASGVATDGNEFGDPHQGSGSGWRSRETTGVRQRLVIDPTAAIAHGAHAASTPAAQREPRTPFNRLNAMFSNHKQQLKSPRSNSVDINSNAKGQKESRTAAALLSPRMLHLSTSSAAKNPFHCKPPASRTGAHTRSHTSHSNSTTVFGGSESVSAHKREEHSSGHAYNMSSSNASSSHHSDPSCCEDITSSRLREYAIPPKIQRHVVPDPKPEVVTASQTLDNKMAFILSRCFVLWVAFIGGIVEASIFLPIAAAGAFAHMRPHDEEFTWSTLAAIWVYLVSRVQGSMGVVAILMSLYLWCYAEFKNQRRRRRIRIADKLLQEECDNFAHVDVRLQTYLLRTRLTLCVCILTDATLHAMSLSLCG